MGRPEKTRPALASAPMLLPRPASSRTVAFYPTPRYPNRMKRRAGSAILVAPLLLALEGTLAGCSGPTAQRPARVAIIGIDAASLDLVARLAAEGLLPHLRSLMERGAYGVLESLVPTNSPALWTSMATGQPPEVHGILSFRQSAQSEGARLVNATMRRVPALWSIASRHGRSVGFVGWWVTWPAEEVEGFMISDHVAYTRHHFRARDGTAEAADYAGSARDTHPPGLRQEIAPLVRHPSSIDPAEVEGIVHLEEEERAELLAGDLRWGTPFRVLALAWQQDATYRSIGLHLIRTRGQPDLFAIFFRGTDSIGHLFWHTFEPEKAPGTDPERARRLGKLLPGYYARVDGFVGEILAALDPDTDVLVVSDHGMEASGSSDPSHKPLPGEHTLKGLWIAAGPHVRPLGHAASRGLLGVAPTVLRLLDIPTALDMPVPPFEDVIEVPWPRREVASHGRAVRPEPPAPSPPEEAILEELRALGYLDQD